MRAKLFALGAACALLAAATLANAAEARTSFAVSAMVVQTVALQIIQQDRAITISPADAARGEVELRASTRIIVDRRRTWLLDFRRTSSIVSTTGIRSSGMQAEFEDLGVVLLPQAHGAGGEVSIDYAFRIRPGTPAGVYAWPLVLTLLPM